METTKTVFFSNGLYSLSEVNELLKILDSDDKITHIQRGEVSAFFDTCKGVVNLCSLKPNL